MKKILTIFSLILLAFVGVFVGGCGDKYEKMRLSISTSIAPTNGVITLIIGDNQLGSLDITATVSDAPKNFNYKSSYTSLMGKVSISPLIETIDDGSKVTITPLYPGEDTVAITTSEGNKVEYVRLRVIKRATAIAFTQDDISLVRGSTTEDFARYINITDSDSNETLINNFTYQFKLSQNIELSEDQLEQLSVDSAGNLTIGQGFTEKSFVVKATLSGLETQYKTINVLSPVENITISDYNAGEIIDLYTNDATQSYKEFILSAYSTSNIVLDYDALGEGENKWFDVSSQLITSAPNYSWKIKVSAVKNTASSVSSSTYDMNFVFKYVGNKTEAENNTHITVRSSSAPEYVIYGVDNNNKLNIYSNDQTGISYFSIAIVNQSEVLKQNQKFSLQYDNSKILLCTTNSSEQTLGINEVDPNERIYIKVVGALNDGDEVDITVFPTNYQDTIYTTVLKAIYTQGITSIDNVNITGDAVNVIDGVYYIDLDKSKESNTLVNYNVVPETAAIDTIYINSSNNNIVYGNVEDGIITIVPSQVGNVTLTVGSSNIIGGAEQSVSVVVYRKVTDFASSITGDDIKYNNDKYYIKDNTMSNIGVIVDPLNANYTVDYVLNFVDSEGHVINVPGIIINNTNITNGSIELVNGQISMLQITNNVGIVNAIANIIVTDILGNQIEKNIDIVFYKPVSNVSVGTNKSVVYAENQLGYFDRYDYVGDTANNAVKFTLQGTGYTVSKISAIIQKDGESNYLELNYDNNNGFVYNGHTIFELIQNDMEYTLVVKDWTFGYPATISLKFVLRDASNTEMPQIASVRIVETEKITNISAQQYDKTNMVFWGMGKELPLTLTYSSNVNILNKDILIYQLYSDNNYIDNEDDLLLSSDNISNYGYPAILYKDGLKLTSKNIGTCVLLIVPKDNIKSYDETTGLQFFDPEQNKKVVVEVGDGSLVNPFVITSAEQMINLDLNYYYKLGNNITLNNNFTTLGEYNNVFDGNGYTITISNINPNSNNYGIFTSLASNGTIKNLTVVTNYSINTSQAIILGSIVATNNGRIENCKVTATYDITNNASSSIGAVAGINNATIIGNYTPISDITFGNDNFEINLNINIYGTSTFGGVSAVNNGTIQKVSVGGTINANNSYAIADKGIEDCYAFVNINNELYSTDEIDNIVFELSSTLSQNINGEYYLPVFINNQVSYTCKIADLFNIVPNDAKNTRFNARIVEGNDIAVINSNTISFKATGKIVISINSIYDNVYSKSLTIYIVNELTDFDIYSDVNLHSSLNNTDRPLTFYTSNQYASIYLDYSTIDNGEIYNAPASKDLMVRFTTQSAAAPNTKINNTEWKYSNGQYYIDMQYQSNMIFWSSSEVEFEVNVELYYNINNKMSEDVIATKVFDVKVINGATELYFTNNINKAQISQRSTYELSVSAITDDSTDDIKLKTLINDEYFSVTTLSASDYDSVNHILTKKFVITYNSDLPIKEDKTFVLEFTTQSNILLSKSFDITITPQAVEDVDYAFFAMHKKDSAEQEGNWIYINPTDVQIDTADERWGLLEYYVYPHYADYDYFIIEADTDYLQMDAIIRSNNASGYILDSQSYEKLSDKNAIKVYYRAGHFDNGVIDSDPTYSFRQLYNIRLMLDNRVEDQQLITLTTKFYKADGTEYIIPGNEPIELYAIKDSVLQVSMADDNLEYGDTVYMPYATEEVIDINAEEFDNNLSWKVYLLTGDGDNVEKKEVFSGVQVILENNEYKLIVDNDISLINNNYIIEFTAKKVVYGTQKTYTKEINLTVTLFTITEISVSGLSDDAISGISYYNTPLEVNITYKYNRDVYAQSYTYKNADNQYVTTNIAQAIELLENAINTSESNGSSLIWYYLGERLKNNETNAIFDVRHTTNGSYYLVGKQENQYVEFTLKVNIGVDYGIPNINQTSIKKEFTKDFKVVFTEQTDIDNAIPVYNQTQLENMEADKDYILMNDIYLDDFTPISTSIHSLDGNNKTIYITSSTYASYIENNASLNLALFNTVAQNTIIKNVNISYVNSAEYLIEGSIQEEIPTYTNGTLIYDNGNLKEENLVEDSDYLEYNEVNNYYVYAESIVINLTTSGALLTYGTAQVELTNEQLTTFSITRISEEYTTKDSYHYFIIKFSDQTIYYSNIVKNTNPTTPGQGSNITNEPNENNYTNSSVVVDANTCIITFNKQTTSINFASIAVNNNGTITNCKVAGKVNLDFIETSSVPTTHNAGLVVTNSGYITNSTVGNKNNNFEFSGTGQLAGFVWTNSTSGKISSSYVDNVNIIRKYPAEEGDGSAGFVFVNDGNINSCYAQGMNTAGNSSIMYNDGGMSAIGIASAFVFTNNAIINDCYTNIKIYASGSACGFVYRNENGAKITNCYSISMLNGSSSSNTPFEGVSIEGGEVAYNAGSIEYCYYLTGSASHTKGTNATALTAAQFSKTDSFPTFNINQYAVDSTPYVWEMSGGSPKLVSTMVETISDRILVSKSKTYSSVIDFVNLRSKEDNTEVWYNGQEELTIYKGVGNELIAAVYKGEIVSINDVEKRTYEFNITNVENNKYSFDYNGQKILISINGDTATITKENNETIAIVVLGQNTKNIFEYQNIQFYIEKQDEKLKISYDYYRLAVVESVLYNYRYKDECLLGTKVNPFIIYDFNSYNTYIQGYNTIVNGTTIYGINNGQQGYFRLIKDIDVYQTFITTTNKIFAGIFEGNNMEIANVAIINNDDIGVHENVDGFGLFANTQNAIIKNLYVSIAEVASSKHAFVGGVIGKMSGGYLNNVHTTIAAGRTGIVMGSNIVGGTVGYAEASESQDLRIYNIYSTVKVNSTLFADSSSNKIKYLIVSDDYSNFSEVSYAGAVLGAINGRQITDNQSHAQNLYVSTPSTVSARTAGGVIGIILKDTKVKNINLIVSSDSQFIRASYYMGGIVGENRGLIDIAETTYSDKILSAINTAGIAQTPAGIFDEFFKSPYSNETYETTVAMGGLVGLNIGGTISNAITYVSVRNTTTQFAGGAIGRTVGYGNLDKVIAANSVKSNIIMGGLIGSALSYESFVNMLVSEAKNNGITFVNTLQESSQYNNMDSIDDVSVLYIDNCMAIGNIRQTDTYYLYPQNDINRSYASFIGLIYYKQEEQSGGEIKYEAPYIVGNNNYSINTLYNVLNPAYTNEQYFFVPYAYYSSIYSGVAPQLLSGAILAPEDFNNIQIGGVNTIDLDIVGLKHHEILQGVQVESVNIGDTKTYNVDIVYANDNFVLTNSASAQSAKVIVKSVNEVYINGVKYPNSNYNVTFEYDGNGTNIENITSLTIQAINNIVGIDDTKAQYYTGYGAPQWILENSNNYYTLIKNISVENWKDYATTPTYLDGYYQITNAQELAWLINNPQVNAKLINDIDLSGRYWTPIGSMQTPYSATFDGNGKTIRYTTVNSSGNSNEQYEYAGLFGIVNGTITNLTTEYGTIEGQISGGIVAKLLNNGNINNIVNANQVMATNISGGVIGFVEGGTVNNLINNGAVKVSSQTVGSEYIVGGVVGRSEVTLVGHNNYGAITVQTSSKDDIVYVGGVVGFSNSTVTNSYSQNGQISVSSNAKELYVGGIAGKANGTTNVNTTGNYSKITVSYNRQKLDEDTPVVNVGGVFGKSLGNITRAFNIGNINVAIQYDLNSDADVLIGGIVGSLNTGSQIDQSYNVGSINITNALISSYTYVGGIAASTYDSTINNSYNMGVIAADRNNVFVGGLVGYLSHSYIINSYNNGNVSVTYNDYTNKDNGQKVYNNGVGALAGVIINIDNINTYLNNAHWLVNNVDFEYGAGLMLDENYTGNKLEKSYSTLSQIQDGLKNLNEYELVVESWYPTLKNNKSKLLWQDYANSFTFVGGAFNISSAEELAYLSNQVNSGNLETEGVVFRLTTALDMSNRYFTPIGTKEYPFKGTFEGNNYAITNLTIDCNIVNYDNLGLFGYTKNATISGINIVNNYYADIDSDENNIIGAVIGTMDGGSLTYSFVENTNSIYRNFTINSNNSILGGLVGSIKNTATIDVVYANFIVGGVANTIGAIIGDASEGNVTISNAYITKGVVTQAGGDVTPMFVGAGDASNASITKSFMFKQNNDSGANITYSIVVYEQDGSYNVVTDEQALINRNGWDYTNIWTYDEYTMNGTYPSLRGLGQNWAEQTVNVVEVNNDVYGDSSNKYGYAINNNNDFAYIMQNINNGIISSRGVYFVLTDDIDLSTKYWTPIGNENYPFEGIFDFNGFSINNMVIDSKNLKYVGLFGDVSSYNKNNIAQIIDSKNDISLDNPKANIDNSFVKNTVNEDYINYVGGLVGRITNAAIDNIVLDNVRVMAVSSSQSYSVNVGGLVGAMFTTNTNENANYTVSNVRILNTQDKALVLNNEMTNRVKLVYNDDDIGASAFVPNFQVIGVSQYSSVNAGGLIGYINGIILNENNKNIYMVQTNNSVLAYNQENSNGYSNAGGLVGYIQSGASIAYAIAGGDTDNNVCAISTRGTYAGGVIGEMSNGAIGYVVNNTTIATNTAEYRYMGGIIAEANYATVYNMVSIGGFNEINFNSDEIVGAFVGNVTAKIATTEDPRLNVLENTKSYTSLDYQHVGAIQTYLNVAHDIKALEIGQYNFKADYIDTQLDIDWNYENSQYAITMLNGVIKFVKK